MTKNYKEAIAEALEAVKDISDADLRKAGFEIILKQLIGTPTADVPPKQPVVTNIGSAGNPAPLPVLNKTGLTEEEIATLFQAEGEAVTLKVKPSGSSVPEKQIALAHALLIGYKAVLSQDNVASLLVTAAAREWNIWDSNMSKKIQAAGYIQAKGTGKAAIYSLKPGAIDKLRESMQKMARGE